MTLLGFSMGSSDSGGVGKSLDDIIADRRKEQANASSGKNARSSARNNKKNTEKKNAITDRSIATGRAKRTAAARARRGLTNDKKPSAMEVEKEVYRQSRKTATAKKNAEKKAGNGRLPPNSSLRAKNNINDPPGVHVGKKPQPKQIKAAIQGMALAGCPVPKGFQLVMQFSAVGKNEKGKGKQPTGKKGKQPNANNNVNNNSNNNRRTSNNNNNGNQKKSGRGRNN